MRGFYEHSPWQQRQRCIGSNECISMSMHCYIQSTAVKVTILLMLPVAETTISLLLAMAVLCGAAKCICAIGRRGCITHCSEQEGSVLFQLVQIFLKMLKQSNQNYLFLKYSSCQSFGTPDHLLTSISRKKHMHGCHCTKNLLKIIFPFL